MSIMRRLTPPIGDSIRMFFCMGAGDILAQTYIEEKELKDINVVRTVKFATLGMFVVSPMINYWRTMDFHRSSGAVSLLFGGPCRPTGTELQKQILRVLRKILLYQLVFAPVLNLGTMAAVGVMNGDKSETIRAKIDKDFKSVMKENYKVWPAAQLVNNLLMPPAFRLPFYQAVAVYWYMYLSGKLQGVPLSDKDRKKRDEGKKKEADAKKKEADAKKKEAEGEAKKRESDAKKRESDAKKIESDAKKRESDAKKKVSEAKRKELEKKNN